MKKIMLESDIRILALIITCITECTKILFGDLVVTCDETVNTLKIAPVIPFNGMNYWLIAVAVLAIMCLL